MDKNVKIALGCFGIAMFAAGTIVGGCIEENVNKKLVKTFYEEIERVHKENEQLKIRILNRRG